MEDQLLYSILKYIKQEKICNLHIAGTNYYFALETIGLIKRDWDTTLTSLGENVLSMLSNKFERW